MQPIIKVGRENKNLIEQRKHKSGRALSADHIASPLLPTLGHEKRIGMRRSSAQGWNGVRDSKENLERRFGLLDSSVNVVG
jgi:hypothetical protein